MKKLFLLFILLLLPLVNARELNLDYNIEYGKVLVNYKFSDTPAFELSLPSDFSALSLYINNKPYNPEILENIIKLPASQEIEFNFLTKDLLERSGQNTFFLSDISIPFNLNSNIKLTLPENAILSKPLGQGSVFPAAKISTDGQRIILEWETNNALSVFVIFKEKKNYIWILIPLLLIIFSLVILLKKKPKEIKKIVKQQVKLKPDEQKIVDILKKKNGECEQVTLQLITSHPKATLSRILKELEERNIIKKISKGKKNIIVLK